LYQTVFHVKFQLETASTSSVIAGKNGISLSVKLNLHLFDFCWSPPCLFSDDIGGPKTTYFRRPRNSMATLRANISGEEHDTGNRETAFETTSQNFANFGPITAKNRTAVSPTLRKFSVLLQCH